MGNILDCLFILFIISLLFLFGKIFHLYTSAFSLEKGQKPGGFIKEFDQIANLGFKPFFPILLDQSKFKKEEAADLIYKRNFYVKLLLTILGAWVFIEIYLQFIMK